MSTSNRNLYSKNILVRMANTKNGAEPFKNIHITVDYLMSSIPSHKTELIIKLTDENDPFFLYSLYLNEEDYQSLKASQGLLVDFNAFGQRFIDLLQACEKDSESSNPKFQLYFVSKEPLINAILEIVEINPFKHLCHLSLCFSPGNDNDVKKYLASCLVKMREDYGKLFSLHEDTKLQLNNKLDNSQKSLTQKLNEIERLKVDFDANTERLVAKHEQELTFERERSAQSQFSMQQRHEKEKREWEASSSKALKQMEERVGELEAANKELVEKRYKNETQIQELDYRNKTLQEDVASTKAELSQYKKENSQLDMRVHEGEKLASQLTNRVAVLEQELKDKHEQVRKLQDSLFAEQTQCKQLEENLKEKQTKLKEKQAEINHYIDEFKKGNESYSKLQEERNKMSAQLKVKTKIVVEQEKKVQEKERECEQMSSEMQKVKKELTDVKDELGKVSQTLKQKSSELDEANKKLGKQEGLINYYNKQLIDKNIHDPIGVGMSSSGGVGGGGVMKNFFSTSANDGANQTTQSSSAASFRPYGNLLSTNSHFINSNLSPSPSGFLQQAATASKLTGAMSPTALNMGLANELDLTGGNPSLSTATRLGLSSTGGFSSNSAKNPLLSSSASSMQHQQIDHSKENLEINPLILSSRAENLKLGSTSSSTTNGQSVGSSSSGKLDAKFFHNPHQINTNSSNQIDLLKKQPQLSSNSNAQAQLTGGNTKPGGLTGLTSSTMSNNMGAMSKPMKLGPPLASAYYPQ